MSLVGLLGLSLSVFALVVSVPPVSATSMGTTSLTARAASAIVATARAVTPAHKLVAHVASGFVTRTGSQLYLDGQPFRFAGANMYWLALDDNTSSLTYPDQFEIDYAMTTAEDMGATVVRTFVDSVGCTKCIEPTLGNFNPAAFQSLDYAVASAQTHGIRLIITLVDNWPSFEGGKLTYTGWLHVGESSFFTDPAVIDAYKQFIGHVLTHVDPYTGLAYDANPTIMGWETGNEIWCQTCGGDQGPDEASWTTQIADYLKSLAPNQLVVSGLDVGLTCTSSCLDTAVLSIPAVDIVDDHFYPMIPARVSSDSAEAATYGKAYTVGEYAWNGGNLASLTSFLDTVNASSAAGDLFWDLIPQDQKSGFQPQNDGYQFHYSASSSEMVSRINEIRGQAYAIEGASVPAVPIAAPPLATGTWTISGFAVQWSGSAGAMSYVMERSVDGGVTWQVVATGLIDGITGTASASRWVDPHSISGAEYRMASRNLDGVQGPWSAFDRPAARTSNGTPASEVAGGLPQCSATQLRVSGLEASGAAVSAGWIVRLRNASAHGCSLSGYPSVRGINQWNGAVLTAAHTLNSYIGGWLSGKAIPTVDLKAKGGVASFLIDFVTNNDYRACPYVTSLRVSVPHSTTVFTLKSRLQVCKYFQVHPFVPGLTGGNL